MLMRIDSWWRVFSAPAAPSSSNQISTSAQRYENALETQNKYSEDLSGDFSISGLVGIYSGEV